MNRSDLLIEYIVVFILYTAGRLRLVGITIEQVVIVTSIIVTQIEEMRRCDPGVVSKRPRVGLTKQHRRDAVLRRLNDGADAIRVIKNGVSCCAARSSTSNKEQGSIFTHVDTDAGRREGEREPLLMASAWEPDPALVTRSRADRAYRDALHVKEDDAPDSDGAKRDRVPEREEDDTGVLSSRRSG